MRKVLAGFILFFVLTHNLNAQKAVLRGNVSDEKTGETIVGASVIFNGTTTGAMTDLDGNFEIKNIMPGTYELRCSFISYQPQQMQVVLGENDEKVIDFKLGEAVVEVEEVNVVARVNRDNEILLLMEQKEADGIKESIGAKRLSSLGVSNAASATTKITGVTKNESSGDIYIRGLGDRYLITTMNGLPIPSDDVEKKNIDLNLFSTDIIKNVGVEKTYNVSSYADQSSGAVNINSKNVGSDFAFELSAGSNTNILANGTFGSFKATQNNNNLSLGFYNSGISTLDAVKMQSWNTSNVALPLNYGFSVVAGNEFKLFRKSASFFATLSHDNSYDYYTGVYKKYRSNILDNSFTDTESWSSNYNTTGLLNFTFAFSPKNILNFNSLLVLKTSDNLYEQGRNAEGYVFDQDPQEYGAFVRDQNLKTNFVLITQLLGKHELGTKNKLNWALGYNLVNSNEPNRIRNEVNILDANTVQFAHVGDFQQRKSSQSISDFELNGNITNDLVLINNNEINNLVLSAGANFRYKERDFSSLFIGVRAKGVQTASIDMLDEALLNQSLYNTRQLIVRERKPDLYTAALLAYAGFVNLKFETGLFSGNTGVRFEHDYLNVDWDVANYVGRNGQTTYNYNNILPALNLKYQLSEKSALRIAAGKTVTLPEFKELAPFEYVSPTGRVTKGNPDLKKSVNYNVDLKWEMYPTIKELFSVAAFYKMINDPINLAQTRGSSGNFIYENTGEKANVYGVELETRFGLIDAKSSLDLSVNATKMWFKQDLLPEFVYNNKTELGLQGAAGFISNASLSFSNKKENEFTATLTGNYSSDKILALGAPEDFDNSDNLFNNEIIEKGFATIDLVIGKKFNEKVSLKITGKNLLNPKIEQTQEIAPLSGIKSTEVVSSYKKGMSLNVSIKINLN